MKKEQQQVKEFMLKAEQDCPSIPEVPHDTICNLRFNLIHEELSELLTSMQERDLVQVADAIGDLLVVVLGTAVAFGIDIDPIFQEVHRSNMTKFIDGHKSTNPRTWGKWIKGPSYSPANLEPIIRKQQKII